MTVALTPAEVGHGPIPALVAPAQAVPVDPVAPLPVLVDLAPPAAAQPLTGNQGECRYSHKPFWKVMEKKISRSNRKVKILQFQVQITKKKEAQSTTKADKSACWTADPQCQ